MDCLLSIYVYIYIYITSGHSSRVVKPLSSSQTALNAQNSYSRGSEVASYSPSLIMADHATTEQSLGFGGGERETEGCQT